MGRKSVFRSKRSLQTSFFVGGGREGQGGLRTHIRQITGMLRRMAGYLYLHGGMPDQPRPLPDCRPALAGDRFRPNGEPPDAGSAGRLLTGFGLLRRQLVRGSHQTAAVPGDVPKSFINTIFASRTQFE